MTSVKIGIIGGSGVDVPSIMEEREEKFVDTPFGKPSDVLVCGKVKGVPCVILARHGRGHSIMPTNVNYRANIEALKMEGCTHVVVTTACGSLQSGIDPGDMVVLDQFIDRTTKRIQTFYDGTDSARPGICHLPMNAPFCAKTSKILVDSIESLGFRHHKTGTALTIEGPRFSSKAESKLWHAWGADIVNMTTVPEVVLANEAALCYAAVALVTDYDSWNEEVESVNVGSVLATFKENARRATAVLLEAISRIANENWDAVLKEKQELVKASTM